MNKQTVRALLGTAAAIIVLFVILSGLHTVKTTAPASVAATTTRTEHIGATAPATTTATISITGLYTDQAITVSNHETVLQALEQLNTENQSMQLETKTYKGLGILVQSMAGQQNGTGNEYWQYKVNGVMPEVGADQLELHSGDTVEWFFASSTNL